MRRCRNDLCGMGDPTFRALLRLVGAFAVAALLAWVANAWRERQAHDDLGPGRIVIQPHGGF